MTDLFNPEDDKSDYTPYIPGETNKYKTLDDLAKGAFEKDRHIKQIERENSELRASNLQLRDDNMSKDSQKELVDRLLKEKSEGNQPAAKDPVSFDPNQLESKFQEWTKKHEATKTREQNARAVTEALRERFGANYQDALQKQVEDLGLTREAVNYLAETAPKAFFKTLGLDQTPRQETFEAPPRRSPMFSPTAEHTRSWTYYQKMKKEQPSLYNNPKTQEQMMKDYQRLGNKFEDGDFLSYGTESAF